jgi:putative serine protease PepD
MTENWHPTRQPHGAAPQPTQPAPAARPARSPEVDQAQPAEPDRQASPARPAPPAAQTQPLPAVVSTHPWQPASPQPPHAGYASAHVPHAGYASYGGQPPLYPPGAVVPVGPVPPPRGPRRWRRWTAGGALALVLVAGGGAAGAAIVHGRDGGGVAPSSVVSATNASSTGSMAAMIASVRPSVVSITVTLSNGTVSGSGVIIRSDGMILTNNHVIADAVSAGGAITVTFSDGSTRAATVIGTDSSTDLAVIQAKNVSNLKPATLGDSGKMAVGDTVVAIGSPLDLEQTVTEGIVSALNRTITAGGDQSQQPDSNANSSGTTYRNMIQTDAALNEGNSGGPLVNAAGQVIGINSVIATSGSNDTGNIGLGFAIPINTAKQVADKLMQGH